LYSEIEHFIILHENLIGSDSTKSLKGQISGEIL